MIWVAHFGWLSTARPCESAPDIDARTKKRRGTWGQISPMAEAAVGRESQVPALDSLRLRDRQKRSRQRVGLGLNLSHQLTVRGKSQPVAKDLKACPRTQQFKVTALVDQIRAFGWGYE